MSQPQQNTTNIVIFVTAMVLCFLVWAGLKYWVFPTPPAPTTPPDQPNPEARVEIKPTPELAALAVGSGEAGLGQGLWQTAILSLAEAKAEKKPVEAPPPAIEEKPPTPPGKYLHLGEVTRDSKFHLYIDLDPRGASVERVVLNKFQQADPLGRPEILPGNTPKPMELVPPDPENPSNLLLAYDVNNKADDKPFDTLGKVDWSGGEDGKQEPTVMEETLDDGRVRQSVAFVSPPNQGFQITKTYSLTQGEYHIALDVKVHRLKTATLEPDKAVAFRYQLCTAHGLPVEGRWYTNIFRDSLVGLTENKDNWSRNVVREMQTLHDVMGWEGGKPVMKKEGYTLRYAAVVVQYFASAVVVDTTQEKQDYLAQARPTLEKTVTKGVVKSIGTNLDSFALTRATDNTDQTFLIRKDEAGSFLNLHEGMRCAVLSTSGSFQPSLDNGKGTYPEYAHKLQDEAETQPVWEDDVAVRVTTEPIELKPGEEQTHKYLLYNGPVKAMLLSQPDVPVEAVPPGVVSHYIDDLNLNTLKDYQSNGSVGSVTSFLYITPLLIKITNVMHWVLWWLHYYLYIPYILCIVCLTLTVRGLMFPVSRKQAMTSLRMQQLAPELKKLQEKFKEDKQGMAAAQMELYRKHGVNPFGTCWLLLLQMPIFMGLYYALQESIHFRLAGVSTWWMPNLSAPDMLVWWSNKIPFISSPDSYGGFLPFLYLGPYLNILPILAVSLMMVQQKWTMPPPTDDTQAQQQKMMKYMMVFMGLMFYKVASGLCIYFIASSVWGFCERQLLPKKKPGAPVEPPDDKPPGILARLLNASRPGASSITTAPATGVSEKTDNSSLRIYSGESRGGKGKRGKRRQDRARGKSDGPAPGDGSMMQRLRDWWDDILEQARKK